jgi:hypothetical protein
METRFPAAENTGEALKTKAAQTKPSEQKSL